MYLRKINYIWAIDLILLIGVVFLGIEQAGRGSDISKLENDLEIVLTQKRDLTENIFSENNKNINERASELGYLKPSNILYFDLIDTVASRQYHD